MTAWSPFSCSCSGGWHFCHSNWVSILLMTEISFHSDYVLPFSFIIFSELIQNPRTIDILDFTRSSKSLLLCTYMEYMYIWSTRRHISHEKVQIKLMLSKLFTLELTLVVLQISFIGMQGHSQRLLISVEKTVI